MRSTSICRTFVLFSACLFSVGTEAAQVSVGSVSSASQDARLPRTRGAADVVVVDVVVTDDNNQPVKGLQQRDFRVFENNKPQPIRSFEAHDEPADPAAPGPPSLPANTFTNAGSSALGTINVVLLDQLNTSIQDQTLALRELSEFFTHKPADAAFAIFTLRDDEVACKPYQREQWSYGAKDDDVPDWDSGCASMGRLLLVQGVTNDKDRLIAAIHGSDAGQPHPTWLRMQLALRPPMNITEGICGFPGASGLDYYNGAPVKVFDSSMPSLAEIGNFLQSLPGRKSLIWLSDNFDAAPVAQRSDVWFPPKFRGWENTDVFSENQVTHLTAGRIALARVAVYPVDLTGKNKGIDVKRVPAYLNFSEVAGFSAFPARNGFVAAAFPIVPEMPRFNTCDEHGPKLDSVADETGGRAFHKASRIQNALMQAASDGMDYYTLTYSPTKAKFNGQRREIKVTLNGKDYHLAYRKTYYADDPSTLWQPDGNALADVYIPTPGRPMPWAPLRVSGVGIHSNGPQDPILVALGYGTPESHSIVFSAHVEPTQDLAKATTAQMDKLQDYASFRAERIGKAMQSLTKEEKKTQHKGRTVLDSLPQPDPVLVQPYSIDYSIPARQLGLKENAAEKNTLKLEVAVLAYDALGKKVTGLKQDVDATISTSELRQVQTSDYHVSQTLDIPARATMLRLAVRDAFGNELGSLEIPLWAIQSPYRRKQLRLPVNQVDSEK